MTKTVGFNYCGIKIKVTVRLNACFIEFKFHWGVGGIKIDACMGVCCIRRNKSCMQLKVRCITRAQHSNNLHTNVRIHLILLSLL